MGHGSELTTYEHYVHCLDLLLFLDTWHGRYDQGPRHYKGRLGPLRHESAQLLVLLGYSTATRIEMKDPVALLRRIGERYPKAAVLLESTITSTPVRVPGAAAPALPTRFSLKHLCGLPGAETLEGFPRQQAELDAVAGLLQHLLPIDPAKQPLLTSVVTRWVEAKMRGYDWAAMTSDAARAWIADVRQLSPHLEPEALHVYREKRTGRKVKDKISRPGDVASYRSAVGRYWVRLADTRSRAGTRKSRTDQRRSRLQASLSWTLQMLAQESREN